MALVYNKDQNGRNSDERRSCKIKQYRRFFSLLPQVCWQMLAGNWKAVFRMVMTEDRLSSFYDRQGEENSFFLLKSVTECSNLQILTDRLVPALN